MLNRIIFIIILFLFISRSKSCSSTTKESPSSVFSADYLLHQARMYYLQMKYKEAIKIYDSLIKKFPDEDYEAAWANYEAGVCYFLLKKYSIARKYFVTVMQRYPISKSIRILALNLIRKIDYGDPRKRSFY